MKISNIILFACLIFLGQKTIAQELTQPQIDEVTRDVIRNIDNHYIIPDLKTVIVEGLKANLADGKYSVLDNSMDLAKEITKDLGALSDDKHLYLVSNAEKAKDKKSPKRQMMRGMPDPAAFKDLLTYQMLEGGIAYIHIPMFGPLEYLQADFDAFLDQSLSAHTLIIDLRQCPGGSGQSAAYLAGGFIDQPIHLTTYYGADGETQLYSAKTNYGQKNNEKEVYVLISDRTGSAAEGFAFYLQQAGRVRTVGQQSSGAGRSNQFFPIAHDFKLSVSIRTSITPNGKQFQGIGVRPDILTPSSNALDQAKIESYRRMIERHPEQKSHYDRLISEVGKPEVRPKRGDHKKIKVAVLGYIENFFENNIEAMFDYLHPQLAKRGWSRKKGSSELFLQDMTKEELTQMLKKKKALLKKDQKNSVEILDIFHNSATVRIKTGYPGRMEWIEYIHLCRVEEEWKIINIFWDYYPKKNSKNRK